MGKTGRMKTKSRCFVLNDMPASNGAHLRQIVHIVHIHGYGHVHDGRAEQTQHTAGIGCVLCARSAIGR